MRKYFVGCLSVLAFLALTPVVFIVLMGLFYNPRVGTLDNYADSPRLAAPPPPLAEPLELTVVTYNIQDLWPVGAQPFDLRMEAIGAALRQLDPDIVGFQEAFQATSREVLKAACAGSRLEHWHYYESGTVGSGLLTASAWPIAETYFHRFTIANPPYKVWEGDWWAGKGMGMARIALPNGGYVDLFNTHAQAGYGNPYYDVVRAQQMQECADFINAARLPTMPAFAVGDFNCRIGDTDCDRLITGSALEHLRTVEGGIDLIFGVSDPLYVYETLETVRIDGTVEHEGRTMHWSDHDGWLSRIRVTPAALLGEGTPS